MSDEAEALYIISVAAHMLGMHAQTLRKYERAGLVEPSRTSGNLRLYSREDLRRLRQIKRLVDERHVNLAGLELALALTDQIRDLIAEVATLDDPVKLRAVVEARLARMLRVLAADE